MLTRRSLRMWTALAFVLISIAAITGFLYLITAHAYPASPQFYSGDWEPLGFYGGAVESLVFFTDTQEILAGVKGMYNYYLSSDMGNTWTPVINSLYRGCNRLAYDAENDILYCTDVDGNEGYIERSYNRGQTWESIALPGTILLEIHPTMPEIVYAGTWYGALLRSDDYGEHWQTAAFTTTNGTQTELERAVIDIAVDPKDNDVVYAAVGANYEQPGQYRGIYKSTDGGFHFDLLLTDDPEAQVTTNAVGVSPIGTVFAITNQGDWRSYDDGETWEQLDNIPSSDFTFHPTQPLTVWTWGSVSYDEGENWEWEGQFGPALVYPGDNSIYYALAPFGIVRSDDSGENWEPAIYGIQEQSVVKFYQDPYDYRRYYVWGGGGIGYTEDNGSSWIFPIAVDSCCDLQIDPRYPQTIYLAWNNWIWISVNGGKNWVTSQKFALDYTGDGPYAADILLIPEDENQLFLAVGGAGRGLAESSDGGVYYSTDGGMNWSLTDLDHIPVRTLLYDKTNQLIYAGTTVSDDGKSNGGVYVSDDFGVSWEKIGLDGISVFNLIADPRNPQHIYAGTRGSNAGGIYKTTNGGASWGKITPPEMTEGFNISIDPENADNVYAIADQCIYFSTDAGLNWRVFQDYDPTLGELFDINVGWQIPSSVTGFSASIVDPNTVEITVTLPLDEDISGVLLRYSNTEHPEHYYQGETLPNQSGSPGEPLVFTRTLATTGNPIYLTAFAYDDRDHLSDPTYTTIAQETIQVIPASESKSQTPSQDIYLANERGLYYREAAIEWLLFLPITTR